MYMERWIIWNMCLHANIFGTRLLSRICRRNESLKNFQRCNWKCQFSFTVFKQLFVLFRLLLLTKVSAFDTSEVIEYFKLWPQSPNIASYHELVHSTILQIGCGAHPASLTMDTGDCFLRRKADGTWKLLPPFNVEFKNGGAVRLVVFDWGTRVRFSVE
jgi:hypothetical protein